MKKLIALLALLALVLVPTSVGAHNSNDFLATGFKPISVDTGYGGYCVIKWGAKAVVYGGNEDKIRLEAELQRRSGDNNGDWITIHDFDVNKTGPTSSFQYTRRSTADRTQFTWRTYVRASASTNGQVGHIDYDTSPQNTIAGGDFC